MADESGKYGRLTEYLKAQEPNPICMPFGQIEQVLGFSLPTSARVHQAWWANQPRGQSLSWLRAGYRTTALSLDEERLTFVPEKWDEAGMSSPPKRRRALTIAEAKEGLAASFGVDPSQIEITIRA